MFKRYVFCRELSQKFPLFSQRKGGRLPATDDNDFDAPSETEVVMTNEPGKVPLWSCRSQGCLAALEENANLKARVAEIQMAL